VGSFDDLPSRGCVNLEGVDLNDYVDAVSAVDQFLIDKSSDSVEDYLIDYENYDPSQTPEDYITNNLYYSSVDQYLQDWGYDSSLQTQEGFITSYGESSLSDFLSSFEGVTLPQTINSFVNDVLGYTSFQEFVIQSHDYGNGGSLFGKTKLSHLNFENVVLKDTTLPVDIPITSADFSSSKGMSAQQLLSVDSNGDSLSLSGVKFPPIDLSGVSFSGVDIASADFSAVSGFTGSSLTGAVSSNYMRLELPENFDVAGWDMTGQNIGQIDFSKTVNLTDVILERATNYAYLKFPQGLDLSGFDFKGKNIERANFTGVIGITGESFSTAGIRMYYITFPAVDMTNFNASGKNLSGSDFSQTTGTLDLNGAASTSNITLP
jgi:uncharacterized protein YjbI with pentapeptide repeats